VTRRYTRQEGVLWRRAGDAVVLLPADGRQVLTLEGSGVDLWHLLEQPMALDEVVRLLADAYGASTEQVQADIGPVLEELTRKAVVEARDGSS